MNSSNDPAGRPDRWGGVQPKFKRLEYERPRRFFLVGKLASGEPLRIRLSPGRYEQRRGA